MSHNHRSNGNRLLSAVGFAIFSTLLVLTLANCGNSSYSAGNPGSSYITQTPTNNNATTTPGVVPTGTTQPPTPATAYLYSRVDYPLQIPVGSNDTVTLIVSLEKNILTVTPIAGNGQTAVGAPIALPTDVQHYREIDVAASATTSGPSPVVWQLVSPISQTLLNLPGADPASLTRYNDAVDFHWSVRGVNAGQNLATITLGLTYIYLDGHQSQGTVATTQAPIPIVAVQPTPANTWLPNIKLPITLAATIGGLFGILQFLWNAYQTGKEVKEAAAHAHRIITKRNVPV